MEQKHSAIHHKGMFSQAVAVTPIISDRVCERWWDSGAVLRLICVEEESNNALNSTYLCKSAQSWLNKEADKYGSDTVYLWLTVWGFWKPANTKKAWLC